MQPTSPRKRRHSTPSQRSVTKRARLSPRRASSDTSGPIPFSPSPEQSTWSDSRRPTPERVSPPASNSILSSAFSNGLDFSARSDADLSISTATSISEWSASICELPPAYLTTPSKSTSRLDDTVSPKLDPSAVDDRADETDSPSTNALPPTYRTTVAESTPRLNHVIEPMLYRHVVYDEANETDLAPRIPRLTTLSESASSLHDTISPRLDPSAVLNEADVADSPSSSSRGTSPIASSPPWSSPSGPSPPPSPGQLRAVNQEARTDGTNIDALLKTLAETTFEMQALRYQIGCSVVHALDKVQDLAALDRQRTETALQITGAAQGFDQQCHTKFNDFLMEYARLRGPPTTGTSEVRSIANFSHDQLTTVGIDFSSKPASLGLDRVVAAYWSTAATTSATVDRKGDFRDSQ
ncbi:hypothetical protein NMY22_g8045 [Coprinellus aureogranulatus]|nr:hypothetical protein NMY22_g8045 [Coprinellus aureogranulatus]